MQTRTTTYYPPTLSDNELVIVNYSLLIDSFSHSPSAAETKTTAVAGLPLLATPLAPLGGVFITGGSVISRAGTLMSMGLNVADGEWGQLATNASSLALSYGIGRGIRGLKATQGQIDFLNGFSGIQISIFSQTINWGLERKKGR